MDNQTSNPGLEAARFASEHGIPTPAAESLINDQEGRQLVQDILDRKQEAEESWEDNQPCTCTTDCSEYPEENPCYHCQHIDIYEPCPVIGYGCGGDCDCCTPEQQKAAAK